MYVLVEGDEWAHVEALDPDAGYWARRFAQLVNCDTLPVTRTVAVKVPG